MSRKELELELILQSSQAKPSQSSHWGEETCAKLGSMTDTLNITGEYAYANGMETVSGP